jgi:hypothetical protein
MSRISLQRIKFRERIKAGKKLLEVMEKLIWDQGKTFTEASLICRKCISEAEKLGPIRKTPMKHTLTHKE